MLINQDLAYLEHERFVTLGRHGTQAYVSSCCQRSQALVAVTVPFIVLKADFSQIFQAIENIGRQIFKSIIRQIQSF